MGGGYLKLKDTSKESELVSAETLENEKNLIGVYIEDGDDYTKVDIIPDSGYTLNEEKSYCKIGDKEQDMTITYDMNTKNLTIAPMTTKGTKCYLYFDEQKTLKDSILADSKINEGMPDFNEVATTNEGLYKTEDDWGISYYFRGSVDNNWVKFAGYYWRIIRINGDGSIRLIYSGDEESGPVTIGEDSMISSLAFNTKYNRSEYVGYMYNEGEQHGNITDSDIKIVIDNWYNSNLKSYEDKISKEAGFCGDREMANGYKWSSEPSSTIYYAPRERLQINRTPTLKCSNNADLYTVSGSSKGNKALSNPIGLITADEVAMAGGKYGKTNRDYYLYNNVYYWTMSPYNHPSALLFIIDSDGWLNVGSTNNKWGIRPVINLACDVIIKNGNGTSSAPYEI